MTKCAFVASGGGIKAYCFHLGVLRALEDNGFRRKIYHEKRDGHHDHESSQYILSTYIGSSAGAFTAAAAVFFETIEEMEALIGLHPGYPLPRLDHRVLWHKPRLWPLWKIPGISHAGGVEKYLRGVMVHNDFRDIGPEMYIVATQLNGRRKVIFGPKDSGASGDYNPKVAYYNNVPISQAIAASMSVPVFFQPYEIKNPDSGEAVEYLDGEVRETLSAHIARDNEVDLVVVSNTWVPYFYRSVVGSIASKGLLAVFNQAINQMMEQKIERFRNENERHRMLLEFVKMRAKNLGFTPKQADNLAEEAAFVLHYRKMEEIHVEPDPDDIVFNLMGSWSLRRDKLRYIVEAGYHRALKAIEAWKQRRDAQ